MHQHYTWLALLVAVFLAGVGGALNLSMSAPPAADYYRQEWIKALLQAGLIAVLGIVTSAVLERFKDSLQQRRDEAKLRLDVLAELSRAYMDVKLARRQIQASGAITAANVDLLNQKQIVFETHMHNSARLFQRGPDLAGHLRTMEGYLNTVANAPSSSERRDFASAGFKAFSQAYAGAATLMRTEIAGH